jgi:hypothetical protein
MSRQAQFHLKIVFRPDSGWTQMHVETYSIDFHAEGTMRSHLWDKHVEALPSDDEVAIARGLFEQAMRQYLRTCARITPF